MMRICHVISGIDIDNGGPPVALGGLAAAQVRTGMRVSVLSSYRFDQSHDVAAAWGKKGINVRLIGPAREPMSRHADIPRAALEMAESHDLLHVHSMWESIQYHACRAARRAGTPYVMTPHGMLDTWNMSQSRLKKRLYLALRMRGHLQHAAAIHAATEIEAGHIRRFGFRPPVIVEPHGLDLGEFRELPPRGMFRGRYPVLGDRPYVVYLGRIDRKKGLELLVPAFARVKGDAMLVIVGPDWNGMRAQVEQMVRELGLADRVVFTGLLRGADRVAALVDADLLALPSYHENFGIVVAEALAAGTPVIVSDQVYLHPQVVSAGVGGVVPLEIEPLARELERWLADPQGRAEAAVRARPYALEHFDWEIIARHWLDHYGRCITSAGSRSAAVANPRGA